MNNQILGLLGIMRRAGKLTAGFDAVRDRISDKTAELVVVAQDTSPKTAESITFLAARNDVEIIRVTPTMAEIGKAIGGKKTAVLAITDDGFAKKLLQVQLRDNEEE